MTGATGGMQARFGLLEDLGSRVSRRFLAGNSVAAADPIEWELRRNLPRAIASCLDRRGDIQELNTIEGFNFRRFYPKYVALVIEQLVVAKMFSCPIHSGKHLNAPL
jgi:hypothetical protein